jgi:hypothetical protein
MVTKESVLYIHSCIVVGVVVIIIIISIVVNLLQNIVK